MPDQKNSPKRITRRQLLAAGLTGLGSVVAGTLYAVQIEPFWPTIERLPMDLPNLAPELSGLKLVQVSDLHVSAEIPISYLEKQLDNATALDPDLLVITGDFVTRGDPDRMEDLAGLMRRLHARHGVFAVLGNHDFNRYQPASRPDARALRTASLITTTLLANGVQVLRNECQVIKIGGARLQLAGVDDYWSENYSPEAAFAAVDPRLPCIALSHNPDSMDDLRRFPCHWVLSGHTHGGQVRVPFLGAPILPIRNRQYDAGMFEVENKRLYVNRGLGYLRRIRFNCRPEITEFTLQPRA